MKTSFKSYGKESLENRISGPKRDILTIATVLVLMLFGKANHTFAASTWDTVSCQILDEGTSEGLGPFERASITIAETTIHYPAGIENSNCTYYVVGWGNGFGTSGGDNYPEYFDQLVSYGFVVAASHSALVNGSLILESVQVALNENENPESPLYQKLEQIFGVMGKSGGGIAASQAVQLSPDAVTAVMIAGATPGVSDPALFITGTQDFLRGMVQNGFQGATGPAIYAEEVGANHSPDLDESIDVAELAVSFLRSHLRGESKAYSYIITPDLQSGNWAAYEVKNHEIPSNSAPTAIVLSNTSVEENLPPGLVAILSTQDPDPGDTFVYELVTEEGVGDSEFFYIAGDELWSKVSFDYESQSAYQLRISTTDQGFLTHEETVVIAVTDMNDPYDSWADSYGGSLVIGDKYSDIDTDGFVNLIEYALGFSPVDPANTTGHFKVQWDPQGMLILISKRSNDPNLKSTFERSTDLASWAHTDLAIIEEIEYNTEFDHLTYIVPPSDEPTFVRLKVE